MSELSAFLHKKYGHHGSFGQQIIADLEGLWAVFQPPADPHFIEEICSGDDQKFFQRFWEMSLFARLKKLGIPLEKFSEGPDFRIEIEGLHIWIEAVSPSPGTGLDKVPQGDGFNPPGQLHVNDVPHEKILLRWTSVIRDKHQKFLQYKESGIIKPSDGFVIAVNSIQLDLFFGGTGISQYPCALEAVYPIGPRFIQISIPQEKVTKQGVTYRPAIIKINKSEVPTESFLSPKYSGISAILATHYNECAHAEQKNLKFSVVHNINAHAKINRQLITGCTDYWLDPISDQDYQIKSSE